MLKFNLITGKFHPVHDISSKCKVQFKVQCRNGKKANPDFIADVNMM